MTDTTTDEPRTLYDADHKSRLRERLIERLLPQVLSIPEQDLSAFDAPEKGTVMFRRACVAERMASAGVYLCEGKYLDDRDGRDRRRSR